MFKNKIFILIVSILIAITLILTAAFVLWNFMEKSNQSKDPAAQAQDAVASVKPTKAPSAEAVKANTAIIKDILTNLSGSQNFIKISFAFELENSKGKTEFDSLLDSAVKGTIVQTLGDLTKDQIEGSKGSDSLTATLMNKLNPLLHEGKIKQIWITDKVLQ
ncbi:MULTISPECIES: flagellar basal body-associated FliL family protein [Paenibacillus]|uniref:Flagellar protein FliL n=1 Tax=Paenibacillus chondroitinus TaxID=59842 RepID=A0ABU6DID9_9BACL|nr:MULTISPECIES: flagellar basal body-associated FliL family protein [Paenibacillus]MCY9659039.1 flagellar basal body-associated FliL family protein [Paenibacillus anseongense]MEB4796626.1 flagellar basal body-associated FliL family protein [Paenibacillus chondroitinus]